jgi:HEAT repeat protein
MSEPPDRSLQEGDELWFGLVGPIRVSDEVTPERRAWSEAMRIAQHRNSLDDLAALVASHPDRRVRYEAMPRLRARFPEERLTLDVLVAASRDPDAMIREGAVMTLGDLRSQEAADAVAERLTDREFDVRLSAAETLAFLGDDRAPSDPEVWALQGLIDGPPIE